MQNLQTGTRSACNKTVKQRPHFIAPLTTMTQKFPLTIYHQKGSKLKQLQYVYHIDVILSYNMTTIM